MLFSLIGFETQTCTIICEFICNIIFRCNPAYVMCICLTTILVVMLIYRGLLGHSADYRVYMSESMCVSTC